MILVAMVLTFDKDVRRHKAVVIACFVGLVVVAGSSPFVWAALATAIPAAQPLGVLSIFAMAAPAPARKK
jgi:predicted metal-binding membrane protein